MNVPVFLIFLFSTAGFGFCDYKLPDNWETVTHEGFSWEDYKFDSNNEALVLVFRARDCMGCIKKVIDTLKADGREFIGIAGYMKERELFGINTSLKDHRSKILRDQKYRLIRSLKLRKTPVLLILNRKLEYKFADEKLNSKYLEEEDG